MAEALFINQPSGMRYSTGHFAVYTMLPILVIDVLLAPFWFVPDYPRYYAWLPVSQAFLSGLLFPMYLAAFGSACVWRGRRRLVPSTFGLLAAAAVLGNALYYVVWGASTRLFWHPDIGTVALCEFLVFWALLITLVPVVLVGVTRLLMDRL